MKKYFPHISAFILTCIIIFVISGLIFPQTTLAQASQQGQETGMWGRLINIVNPLTWAKSALSAVVEIMLRTVGLLTGLAGVILNGVIYYTVGQMSVNYSNLTTINTAWSTIRDLANMGFIFILLYAAIQTILGIGSDTKKLIVNIIVVAILINFSLFFTKLIIDISNILAIMFYDAIAPGALNTTATLSLQQAGLSNAFMQNLGLQSLYDARVGIPDIITIGIMGSIMLLIAAFVFFAAALMFIIRYVILILVIILSPIAFMAFVLPALKQYGDRWWNALSGQAFFAPIYLLLTWITLHVLGGATGAGGITGAIKTSFGVSATNAALSGLALTNQGVGVSPGAFAMFINFIVVIVFLIASLIISKEWSNKTGGGVSKLTKWATGAAIGGAALAGRHTLGRGAAAIADSERLKDIQKEGGAKGMAARLTLAAGRKTAGASLDIRGVGLGIGGAMDAGKAGGKGGFAEFRKKQAEAAEKTAKALGPSDVVLDQAEQAVKGARTDTERRAAQARLDQLKGIEKKEIPKRQAEVKQRQDQEIASDLIIKKEKDLEQEIKKKETEIASTLIPQLKAQREQELVAMRQEFETAKIASKARRTAIETRYKAESDSIKEVPSMAQQRKEAYAKVMENSYWAKALGYNKAAAAQIRRGKSKEKKLAEAYKDVAKDLEPEAGGETETPSASEGGTPPPTT